MNPELMDPELQIGRTDSVPDRGGSENHVGLLAILAQLGYLLLDLDRQRDLLEHPFELPNKEVAVWKDVEHTYIEVRLPHALAAPIDVSLLHRKLFMRIGR